VLPETWMSLAYTPDIKTQRLPNAPPQQPTNIHHAFFNRVRRPSADGVDERFRFLTGTFVGPMAWVDASSSTVPSCTVTVETVDRTLPLYEGPM
jgi:hypothetical protein